MAELRLLTARQLRQVYRERVRSDFPPSERRPLASMERLRAEAAGKRPSTMKAGAECRAGIRQHLIRRTEKNGAE